MNTGRPSADFFLRDAWARFKFPLTPSILSVLIVLIATVAMFATVGFSLAMQQRTLDRINSAEGRLITVSDPQGRAGLVAANIGIVQGMNGVDWVQGIGTATDVRNQGIPGGSSVLMRSLYGEPSPGILLSTEFELAPGQALADAQAAQTLGLYNGVGSVGPGAGAGAGAGSGGASAAGNGSGAAVVMGEFSAAAPLQELAGAVLVRGDDESRTERMSTLWVSVADVNQLSTLAAAIRDSLILTGTGSVDIQVSEDLGSLGQDIVQQMARSASWGVAGTLVVVFLLVGMLQFGRVNAMARDIGRARALGATRTTVMFQIWLNAAIGATIGASIASILGLAFVILITGGPPPLGFILGVPVLLILAALIGAVLPGLRAARMDPVKVLRVP